MLHMQHLRAVLRLLRPKRTRPQRLQPAQDQKGGETVLGLAGYYQKFVPNYSDATNLLSDLIEGGGVPHAVHQLQAFRARD